MCKTVIRVPGLPADNPQQAEEASQSGGNANHLCRKCEVRGTSAITKSDEGYHVLFDVGLVTELPMMILTPFITGWSCMFVLSDPGASLGSA